MNWLGLLILISLVYRIRHTGDDTYLRKECTYLVATWVIFSIIQYMFFIYNYITLCEEATGVISVEQKNQRYNISYKVVYWVMILRDLSCMLILVGFQYRASSSQLYFNRLLDLNDTDTTRVAL